METTPMFAIQTPQTITLTGPRNEDGSPGEPIGTLTFQHAHDDVSECQMVLTSKDRAWTYNFNTQGGMISEAYEDDATRAAAKAAEEEAAEAAEAAADEAKAKADADKEDA
jgi:hypothetical protein